VARLGFVHVEPSTVGDFRDQVPVDKQLTPQADIDRLIDRGYREDVTDEQPDGAGRAHEGVVRSG